MGEKGSAMDLLEESGGKVRDWFPRFQFYNKKTL